MIRIDTPEDLAEALGLLRRLARLTQAAVGYELGTTPNRIREYEQGRLNPSAKTLLRLLAAMGHGLAIVPLAPEGHADGLSATETDQGAEIHSPPRVDLPEGVQAISGGAA